MNIKLKATLITLAGFFGLFATLYAMVEFPILIIFALLGAALYLVYRAVLNHLEHDERFKK